MKARRARSEREPTITLINIVFLMLIFFLVAGTVAPPTETSLRLVRTDDIEGTAPAEALVVHPDGRMTKGGREIVTLADYVRSLPEAAREPVRILPDRDLPAARLVAIGNALRASGAERVVIVTERGTP